jgi:hypothetical protein
MTGTRRRPQCCLFARCDNRSDARGTRGVSVRVVIGEAATWVLSRMRTARVKVGDTEAYRHW